MSDNPEIGRSIRTGDILTNYHDQGTGLPVVLLHGSGPGVSALANWRGVIPELAKQFRVIAPDLLGFGYTERPANVRYDMDTWVKHAIGFLDALKLDKVGLVGNSFGGGLSLHLATRYPDRFIRLVLMGSAGVRFELTPGLDEAWGYTPSIENMRRLLDLFAFNRELATDELAELRYKAGTRPGIQEAYAAMFPAPRQRWIDVMAVDEAKLRALPHEVLIIHGREDRIIPLSSSYRMFELISRAQLHVFGRCGHWTQIEHAARFNRLVAGFFAEVR
ncbi:MAG TPA: alpha/beta fold hydrolase [Candidatus Binataceae bacterium]|nr:alpha/beta fold hydrolase [Candidatus Binataceae bacterium]